MVWTALEAPSLWSTETGSTVDPLRREEKKRQPKSHEWSNIAYPFTCVPDRHVESDCVRVGLRETGGLDLQPVNISRPHLSKISFYHKFQVDGCQMTAERYGVVISSVPQQRR